MNIKRQQQQRLLPRISTGEEMQAFPEMCLAKRWNLPNRPSLFQSARLLQTPHMKRCTISASPSRARVG
jgi:hypothetical protein